MIIMYQNTFLPCPLGISTKREKESKRYRNNQMHQFARWWQETQSLRNRPSQWVIKFPLVSMRVAWSKSRWSLTFNREFHNVLLVCRQSFSALSLLYLSKPGHPSHVPLRVTLMTWRNYLGPLPKNELPTSSPPSQSTTRGKTGSLWHLENMRDSTNNFAHETLTSVPAHINYLIPDSDQVLGNLIRSISRNPSDRSAVHTFVN